MILERLSKILYSVLRKRYLVICKKDYGLRNILFIDDNFLLFRTRLKEFTELLANRELRINWSAQSRVDTIDEESLRIAKDGGCWQIEYGIESSSQRILDFYKKGINIKKINSVLD